MSYNCPHQIQFLSSFCPLFSPSSTGQNLDNLWNLYFFICHLETLHPDKTWTNFGSGFLNSSPTPCHRKARTKSRQRLDVGILWTKLRQCLDKCWPMSGQNLDRKLDNVWTNAGQFLDKCWSLIACRLHGLYCSIPL